MTKPKAYLFDIETAPSLGYYWQKWQTDIIDTNRDWYILSYAYKELHSKKIHTVALPDFKRYKRNKEDDRQLVKKLWKLFDKAQILIAHNGDAFDIPKANARFVHHNLNAPSSYQTIDTKKVAKKYFRFDSNSLNDLGRYLGLGKKVVHTGFDLWLGCMAGKLKSWAMMRRYNARDVDLLEKVYLRLRPYMTNHPNIALMEGKPHACPLCASTNVTKQGTDFTRTRINQRWKCKSCGGWSREPMKSTPKITIR